MISSADFEKKQILFVNLNNGEKVSFSNDNIIVKNSDGSVKHQSTCYRLFMLFLVGHLTITSGLIQRSHKFGFLIFLMTPTFRLYDVIGCRNEGNFLLRKRQYQYEGWEIARKIVDNKINNEILLLRNLRNKDLYQTEAIEKLVSIKDKLGQTPIKDIRSLMGYEGSAARIYFDSFF